MSPIEDYLRQLADYVPHHARADVLPEIRSHLLELTVEGQRDGLSAEFEMGE